MRHVMLDLETLGKAPGCPVLSIGAVEFEPGLGFGRSFYSVCGLSDQIRVGLQPDGDTLRWWAGQPNFAALLEPVSLASTAATLSKFATWFDREALVWGNGADFDMPILAAVMERFSYPVPWKPFNSRCFRTLKNLYPHVPKVQPAEAHNALSDAEAQASWALDIAAAGAALA